MRECKVTLVAGKKAVGKTVETIRIIDNYVYGNPQRGIPGRKALIFDVNNEFEDFWYFNNPHRRIPAIYIRDIGKFSVHPKIEVRRIRPFHDDGRKMGINDMADVLGVILDNYRNGLLLLEDINKFTTESLNADLVGSLATVRHIGIDLISHFQGIGRVSTPKLLSNCNFVRLHKTNDTVARHKNKFNEYVEVFQLAENIVTQKYNEGNQRFFLYIDVDNSKIKGQFTNSDIEASIADYIGENYASLINPLVNKVDLETGNKIYDIKSALQETKNRLFKTYFD